MIISTMARAVRMLDTKYVVNFHKINLLSMAEDFWVEGVPARVTDLIKMYKGASPATTHKAINELVKAKFFKVVINKNDKRERILERGTKFNFMETDLERFI